MEQSRVGPCCNVTNVWKLVEGGTVLRECARTPIGHIGLREAGGHDHLLRSDHVTARTVRVTSNGHVEEQGHFRVGAEDWRNFLNCKKALKTAASNASASKYLPVP